MSTVQPRAVPVVLAVAPLDAQARLALVAWLCACFALVAALTGLSVAGGGVLALGAAAALGTAVPAVLLARVAGLPAAFVLSGDELVVRRWLLPARVYRLAGAAVRERDLAWLRRRSVLLGSGYGCRTVHPPGGRRAVHLATTSLRGVLRVETSAGTLLVSPADPEAFVRGVREAHQ